MSEKEDPATLSHQENDIPDVPPPAYDQLYEVPYLQGVPDVTEPGILRQSCHAKTQVQVQQTGTLAQLAYADFLPCCITPGQDGADPVFDTFQNTVQAVNTWLHHNQTYHVLRCETLDRKWTDATGTLETETTIYHQPTYGTIRYLRGIRLWLVPNTDLTRAAQQIHYINLLPKEDVVAVTKFKMNMGAGFSVQQKASFVFPSFKNLDSILDRFNSQLAEKPLPGKILSIETIEIKHKEGFQAKSLNADVSTWTETGGAAKLYVSVLRIYYTLGEVEEITGIGLEDFVPRCLNNDRRLRTSTPQFEKFTPTSERAAQFVQQQKNCIRVTNIQTVFTKISHFFGPVCVKSRSMHHSDALMENSFLQVIRVGYVIPKVPKPDTRFSSALSSRIFVPLSVAHRSAETTSQTVQRINAWLQATGAQVVSAETLNYEYSDTARFINTEKTSLTLRKGQSHHWISTIRLYLDGLFQEPPPEVLPPIPAYETKKQTSGTCVVL